MPNATSSSPVYSYHCCGFATTVTSIRAPRCHIYSPFIAGGTGEEQKTTAVGVARRSPLDGCHSPSTPITDGKKRRKPTSVPTRAGGEREHTRGMAPDERVSHHHHHHQQHCCCCCGCPGNHPATIFHAVPERREQQRGWSETRSRCPVTHSCGHGETRCFPSPAPASSLGAAAAASPPPPSTSLSGGHSYSYGYSYCSGCGAAARVVVRTLAVQPAPSPSPASSSPSPPPHIPLGGGGGSSHPNLCHDIDGAFLCRVDSPLLPVAGNRVTPESRARSTQNTRRCADRKRPSSAAAVAAAGDVLRARDVNQQQYHPPGYRVCRCLSNAVSVAHSSHTTVPPKLATGFPASPLSAGMLAPMRITATYASGKKNWMSSSSSSSSSSSFLSLSPIADPLNTSGATPTVERHTGRDDAAHRRFAKATRHLDAPTLEELVLSPGEMVGGGLDDEDDDTYDKNEEVEGGEGKFTALPPPTPQTLCLTLDASFPSSDIPRHDHPPLPTTPTPTPAPDSLGCERGDKAEVKVEMVGGNTTNAITNTIAATDATTIATAATAAAKSTTTIATAMLSTASDDDNSDVCDAGARPCDCDCSDGCRCSPAPSVPPPPLPLAAVALLAMRDDDGDGRNHNNNNNNNNRRDGIISLSPCSTLLPLTTTVEAGLGMTTMTMTLSPMAMSNTDEDAADDVSKVSEYGEDRASGRPLLHGRREETMNVLVRRRGKEEEEEETLSPVPHNTHQQEQQEGKQNPPHSLPHSQTVPPLGRGETMFPPHQEKEKDKKNDKKQDNDKGRMEEPPSHSECDLDEEKKGEVGGWKPIPSEVKNGKASELELTRGDGTSPSSTTYGRPHAGRRMPVEVGRSLGCDVVRDNNARTAARGPGGLADEGASGGAPLSHSQAVTTAEPCLFPSGRQCATFLFAVESEGATAVELLRRGDVGLGVYENDVASGGKKSGCDTERAVEGENGGNTPFDPRHTRPSWRVEAEPDVLLRRHDAQLRYSPASFSSEEDMGGEIVDSSSTAHGMTRPPTLSHPMATTTATATAILTTARARTTSSHPLEAVSSLSDGADNLNARRLPAADPLKAIPHPHPHPHPHPNPHHEQAGGSSSSSFFSFSPSPPPPLWGPPPRHPGSRGGADPDDNLAENDNEGSHSLHVMVGVQEGLREVAVGPLYSNRRSPQPQGSSGGGGCVSEGGGGSVCSTTMQRSPCSSWCFSASIGAFTAVTGTRGTPAPPTSGGGAGDFSCWTDFGGASPDSMNEPRFPTRGYLVMRA